MNNQTLCRKTYKIGIFGLLLGVCLSACNTQTTQPQTNQNPASGPTATDLTRKDKKVILTTFTVLADMALNVAGDKAIVQSITKPGAEIHGYEVTPSDLKRGKD
ncbi:MAG: metal ABC transporter solute-binding protein, Zn/Mn family, partial [Microcoleus sp.]